MGLLSEITDLQAEQAGAASALNVARAAMDSAAARLRSAERSFALNLREAAMALALPDAELADDRWRTLDDIVLRASAAGTVVELGVRDGAWVGGGEPLLRTLDPGQVRFRARALQGDLGRLRDGLAARVVPPAGGSLGGAREAAGVLRIAPAADPHSRTVDLLLTPDERPDWARPGVGAQLEVVWEETARPELAVPTRALLRDGLDYVLFVRNPDQPGQVIRATPQIGMSDGRWTVIYSDVMEGDEVVLSGNYPLNLTGSGKPQEGGHFHADGTWHPH
jgi:multidrug efflux pump subunit AcrA (membrane-fusion protein)